MIESFPIPLGYIDVARRTNTTLDVLLESRLDDWRNNDGGRDLSEPWTSCAQFTLLNGKTSRTDTCGPKSGWHKIKQHQDPITCGQKSCQEGQKLLNGEKKAALGYRETEARQCAKVDRHIFHRSGWHIQFQETMEKRASELPMESAMPCKKKNYQRSETFGEYDNRKSKHACIVEAHESTRKRLERVQP